MCKPVEEMPLDGSMDMFRERLLRKAYRPRRRPTECPQDVYTCEDEFKVLVRAAQATQPMDRAEWHTLCNAFSDKWEHVCHWVHPSRLADFLTEDMGLDWCGEFPIKPNENRVKVKVKSNVKAQRFKCAECDVICNSYSQYLIHIEGSKHKEMVEQCVARAADEGATYKPRGAIPLDTDGEVDTSTTVGQPQAYFKKDPNAAPTPPKTPPSRPASSGRSRSSSSRSATPSERSLSQSSRRSSTGGFSPGVAAVLALTVGSNLAVNAPSVYPNMEGDSYEPDPHASYFYQDHSANPHTYWAGAMEQNIDDDLCDEEGEGPRHVRGRRKKDDEEDDEDLYRTTWMYDSSTYPGGYYYNAADPYYDTTYYNPQPAWSTPPAVHMEPSGRVRNDPYHNYGVYMTFASPPSMSSLSCQESDSVGSCGDSDSAKTASNSGRSALLDDEAEKLYATLQRHLSRDDIEVLTRLREHIDFESHVAAAAIAKLVQTTPSSVDLLTKAAAAAADAELNESVEQELLAKLSAGPQVTEIQDNVDLDTTDHIEEQNVREAVAYTSLFTFAVGLFVAGVASSEAFSEMLLQYTRNVTTREVLPAEACRIVAPAFERLTAHVKAAAGRVAMPATREHAMPLKLRTMMGNLAAAASVSA